VDSCIVDERDQESVMSIQQPARPSQELSFAVNLMEHLVVPTFVLDAGGVDLESRL